MNALSDLVSEVKFRERMRGYDFEEVDNYVKAVSRAAAQANDRIAELQHRLAKVESQAGNGEGDTDVRETLLRTLVLAQRTADSAVSEARSEASSITDSARERAAKTVAEAETAANERLLSAEERASRMLAEAEENGQLIIAEAKRTAAAELASERERAQEELRDLETSKSELETVVAEIKSRLATERDMLRSLAVSFQSFVEKFEPVAGSATSTDEHEATDGTTAKDADAEFADRDDSDPVAADTSTGDDPDDALEASADVVEEAEEAQTPPSAAADPQDDQAVEADPEPTEASDLEFLPGSGDTAAAPEGALEEVLHADAVAAETMPDLPVVEWNTEIAQDPSEQIGAAAPEPVASNAVPMQAPAGGNGSANGESEDSLGGEEVAYAGAATMPFGVDSPELFDMDAEDEEFIEQLRQVVSSDAPLPEEDAAMAAFFDHDDTTGAERTVSAHKRSGNSGTRSGASDGGGRLSPRA